MGAFDYVMKPCDITDLLEKVEDAYTKKLSMEDKIRKIKVDRIISHPMAVFDKDDSEID
jgi:DNA-binding NtrC family response regulator